MFLPRILPSNLPFGKPHWSLLPGKGNASRPFFPPLSYPIWTSMVSVRTLDDDVAVTSVFRYMITESVLTPKPVQMQPVLIQCLV